MQQLKAQAIVFNSKSFKETDKLVTLLTREFGKVQAIAPAAQRSRRRFGAGLETLTQININYTQKANTSLVRLQEVFILDLFSGVKEDLIKFAYGSYFLEVISEVMPQNEVSTDLFDFLKSFLSALEKTKNQECLCRLFEARLLPLIGYEPILDRCTRCEKKVESLGTQVTFSNTSGGIQCFFCRPPDSEHLGHFEPAGRRISIETIYYLDQMISKDKSLNLNPMLCEKLKSFLPEFLFYQLDKKIKSYAFIDQLQ